MEQTFFSTHVHCSGRLPGKYSMLSIGTCLIENPQINFYKEVKPLGPLYIEESMRIAAQGLKCLNNGNYLWSNLNRITLKNGNEISTAYQTNSSVFNPTSQDFEPGLVLQILNEMGEHPHKVMDEYYHWVLEHSKGKQPIEVAKRIGFDSRFTSHYFDTFNNGKNPFGHFNGFDINSWYRGHTGDLDSKISDHFPKEYKKYNAVEIAIQHAEVFREILGIKERLKVVNS